MRTFRRLPPLLRALGLVALLVLLAGAAIATWTYWPPVGSPVFIVSRGHALAPALSMLGLALSLPVWAYTARHNRSNPPPHWLDRWPGQLLAALVPATLPIVSLVMVLVTPPNSPQFMVMWPLGYFSGLGVLAAFIARLVFAYQ